MEWIYRLGVKGYSAALKLASPFVEKARLFREGRSGAFWDNLSRFSEANNKPIIWVHTASLGEFEQGRPLIEAIRKEFSDFRILLTFFSPSGYEVRKNYDHADYICYLPVDSPANARKWISLLNIRLAIFVKYEFWHFFLKELYSYKIPVISTSSIFREGQLFFKPWGGFNRKTLSFVTRFFVQNEVSLKLLQQIGLDNSEISGDTRFDRVMQIVANGKEIPIAEAFSSGHQVLVMGSVWPPDWELIAKAFAEELPLRLIIAPHEISEKGLVAIEKAFSTFPVIRYSKANEGNVKGARVLLIDNMGMLSSLYAYGKMAYIGGAFGSGLHNTLEAATYGIPVIFGAKYHKFQEAKDLVTNQGGFSISNDAEFKKLISRLLSEEEFYQKSARSAGEYVKKNLGATEKIMDFVRPILS